MSVKNRFAKYLPDPEPSFIVARWHFTCSECRTHCEAGEQMLLTGHAKLCHDCGLLYLETEH